MKWCPKCKRINVEYDPVIRFERCLWWDCGWVNRKDIDLDIAFDEHIRIHGTQFKKFAKSLKRIRSFMDT